MTHPIRRLLTSLTSLSSLIAAGAVVLLGVLPTVAHAQSGAKSTVRTEQVQAELMAHAPDGADAGKTVWVGLQIIHKPEWHTYWKNAGDSGLPTMLTWTLPAGVTAGEIAWPTPQKIRIGNLANYGYEGTVLLPVPLTISPEFKSSLLNSDIDIKLKATWLVCRKECIPEDGEFALKLPVKGSTAINSAQFSAAFAAQPKPVLPAAAGVSAGVSTGVSTSNSLTIDGASIALAVHNLPVALRGKTLEFFPESNEVIETAAAFTQSWNGAVWNARVPLSAQRSNSPSMMPIVLATDVDGQRQSYRTEIKVTGDWPQLAAAAQMPPALEAALKANAASSTPAGPPISLLAAILGALIGGMILNLMPCVFPVLAIKVMSFANVSANEADSRRAHRVSGMTYSAGVVLSFLALGGLMLALRQGGELLGWGFQLQSPAVVTALAILFTVLGLNLAGVFEFGSFLPSSIASQQAKSPVVNSFLSGVLAVAIASPCTAPFMGASLGLAIGLPAVEALMVFGAIGVGMALPYLAASWIPAVARALPRPGPWMDTFRRVMAFPMFATVIWLVWVLGQQSGIDGAGALLALLLALSMVIWALTLRGRGRTALTIFSVAVLATAAGTIGPNILKPLEVAAVAAPGERWQAWEPGRVDQILATGQPVFVDFTAAWCITCQYNKKITLAHTDVLADLDRKNVALLRADWTRRDPAITAAIQQLGRNGVPVYVVYKAGSAPVVMSEILSVDEVRGVLAKL